MEIAKNQTSNLIDSFDKAITFIIDHRKLFFVGFYLLLFALIFLSTNTAHADFMNEISRQGNSFAARTTGQDYTTDTEALTKVGTGLSDYLRSSVNYWIYFGQTCFQFSASTELLTRGFDSLFTEAYPVVRALHESVAIPVANIVLATMLVVGLCRVISRAGQTETGIDIWQLVVVFVLFAFGCSVINASFDLLIMLFDIVRWLIVQTINIGSEVVSVTATLIPDTVTNVGILLFLLVIAIICGLVIALCAVLSNVVIIVRAVQIYFYTAFASIPLAFFVSESGRNMATGFLKRYLAVLFSGVVMAFLMIVMGAVMNGFSLASVEFATGDDPLKLALQMVFQLTSVLAYAYCMFKSSAWARDFVGV